MFNFNLTLLLVFASFLVFMMAMKSVFFDPLMAILAERDKKMQGDRKQAESLRLDCASLQEQYEVSLKEARKKGVEVITKAREVATKQASEQVISARKSSNQDVEAKLNEFAQWREETYQRLSGERESLKQIIISKVTQAGVAAARR